MRHHATILLTGFEPFGEWKRNVSGEAVQALDGRTLEGARLVGRVLPVAHPKAILVLAKALEELRPAAVIGLGIHGEPGKVFKVEEVAVNELDFRIPDNEGHVRKHEPIELDSPRERRATLAVPELLAALRERGLDARISHDAGRYLCNAVYYWLLGRVARVAFVQVPPRQPGEDAADVTLAAETAARVAIGESTRGDTTSLLHPVLP